MASVALPAGKARASEYLGVTRDEWIKLLNWLLVWVVVANAGFAMLWLIGAPPRRPEIIAAGAIGLIVRNQPRWVQFIALVAAMVYSLLAYVSGMFNLAILSVLHSLKFFTELNPIQSTEYIFGAAVLVALMGLGYLCLRRRQDFADLRMMMLAIFAFMTFAQLDQLMSWRMGGHYNRYAPSGATFTSAVAQTDFGAVTGAKPHNLMIVVVESLGLPANNPEMQRLLFARYRQPDVTDRFALSMGTSLYYNSTTSGEIRELCGRWGEYRDYVDERDDSCLPARLRRAGLETTAYHSFSGKMFDREDWYPNIGFDKRVFAEQLLDQGLSECGGVFPGACDREMPHVLADHLKKNSGKPQFVYWLTVNSHLPVPPGENLDVEECARISPVLARDYPMICRQFAIWHDIDAALAREITAPDFPPTDILIVGDHMPPYFDLHMRSQFAHDRVPWLLLKWKGGDAPQDQAVIARSPASTDKG